MIEIDIFETISNALHSYSMKNRRQPKVVYLGQETYLRAEKQSNLFRCYKTKAGEKHKKIMGMVVIKVSIDNYVGFGDEPIVCIEKP